MWKDARIRQSTLDTSELLNIALAAQHLPQIPQAGCWLAKPVWMVGERQEFCTRPKADFSFYRTRKNHLIPGG
jgi:hypothetical protein